MTDFRGKTILITGGTGSFGRAFLGSVLEQEFAELRILSRDELKQEELRIEVNNPKVKFYLGDVRDRDSVDRAMRGVDCVFHAAALKQVPSCEFFPSQAVLTNVFGSQNVIESAVKSGVKKVVCLGTDKAVYPINTMGMTKALMEKVAQATSRSLGSHETLIACVRYGNVMCSRGSVIPLFIKQIKQNVGLTITEPGMTRFLLPLPTAIELVKFAFTHAQQGDIFVRKAPACTIGDLAMALKDLFGSAAPIKIIGIRHGEKIYETLASKEELVRSEDLGDYLRVRMDDRDLNYDKYVSKGDADEARLDDYTSHNTERLSIKQIQDVLVTLPEVTRELQS